VWERFGVDGLDSDAFTGRPVLLVDDLVDSRWTVTVAGRALRRAGASAVLPFVAALRA
jgi:ATP-dependent DNA helicase RecQ